MKNFFLMLMLFSSPALASLPLERGWVPDLNVDLGMVAKTNPLREVSGMVRVRAGALYMLEPWYLTIAPIYQYTHERPLTFGAQLEALNLWTGFTFTASAFGDAGSGEVAPAAGIGWSLFGIEAQLWPGETLVLAKLRVPITWLGQVGKPPRIRKD